MRDFPIGDVLKQKLEEIIKALDRLMITGIEYLQLTEKIFADLREQSIKLIGLVFFSFF